MVISNRSGMRVSIVTPSFNQGQYLDATIRSVISQEYPNLEYLVVDGGSTDGSREILQRHASRLAWWVSEPDAGQADAINKGFCRATGDILAWLNSDDLYLPGTVAAVVDFFRHHPQFDAVVGDLNIIDAEGRHLDVKKAVPVTFRWNLYSGCAVAQPATFFTRRAYEISGELDPSLRFQMDYDFFLRMQSRGVRFGVLKRPLTSFRLHATSKTVAEYDREFWRDFARIQDAYLPPMRSNTLRSYRRSMMKIFSRLEMFVARALFRGVWSPYRYTRIRRRVTLNS